MSIHTDFELQNEYARRLQAGVPLYATPFAVLARELDCSSEIVGAMTPAPSISSFSFSSG